MGLFTGIKDARLGKGGFYFLDGNYIVDVVKCYAQESRKKGQMFIVEASVVWSNNPERKVGQVPSWVIPLLWETSLGHLRNFLGACNNADPDNESQMAAVFTDEEGNDLTETVADFAVHPDNPLAGTRLELEVFNKPSQKTGKDFSMHKWKPYNEEAFTAWLQAQQQ